MPLPDGVQIISAGHGGGPRDGEATRARILSPLTISALLASVQAELDTQGWQRTSIWQEADFAGSSWKTDGEARSGVLTIVSLGGDEFDLRFSVISRR